MLAEGLRHAAARWDLEDIAVHVKGMEPAGYDPRPLKGMGLAYATFRPGGLPPADDVLQAHELSGMIDPGQVEGKAELFIDFEDRLTLFDTLILCRFYRDLYPWEALREMLKALTGIDEDIAGLPPKGGGHRHPHTVLQHPGGSDLPGRPSAPPGCIAAWKIRSRWSPKKRSIPWCRTTTGCAVGMRRARPNRRFALPHPLANVHQLQYDLEFRDL